MGPKADFQHSERPRLERSCPNLWNKRCDLTDAYFSNSEGKIELLYRNLQSSHKKGPSKPLFKEKGTRSAEHSSSSSAGITSSKYSLRNKDSFDGPSGLVYINRSGLVRQEQADMYGCGAFSDVFIGVIQKEEIDSEIPIEQPGQEVKVAIKKFRVHALRGKDVSKLFADELRIWSKLKHPNILPLLGYYIDGCYPSILSEWMERGTARRYVKENHLSIKELLPMLLGIVDGVRYLHENDIVHSDINAANILISLSRKPLICDFGLSFELNSSIVSRSPEDDSCGTIRFLAPELFDQVSSLHTKATDIWALGMTFYELISNELPFSGKRDAQVIFSVINREIPSFPSKLSDGEECVDVIWRICLRCWIYSAEGRISVQEVFSTLEISLERVQPPIPLPPITENTEHCRESRESNSSNDSEVSEDKLGASSTKFHNASQNFMTYRHSFMQHIALEPSHNADQPSGRATVSDSHQKTSSNNSQIMTSRLKDTPTGIPKKQSSRSILAPVSDCESRRRGQRHGLSTPTHLLGSNYIERKDVYVQSGGLCDTLIGAIIRGHLERTGITILSQLESFYKSFMKELSFRLGPGEINMLSLPGHSGEAYHSYTYSKRMKNQYSVYPFRAARLAASLNSKPAKPSLTSGSWECNSESTIVPPTTTGGRL